MTKQELEQLKELKKELERAKSEYLNAKPIYESDSVFGSTEENPENRVIPVRGYTYHDIDRKLKRYERLIKKFDDEIDRLEDWIEDVPDSLTRQILQLKYRNGLTHEQISYEIGFSSRTVDRKLKEFWGE
ncbi:MAG: hypothetical protein PHE79_12045 [Eubacteriales bacterium]|nr:hypothetical protein [Eubacteriales bacterium]